VKSLGSSLKISLKTIVAYDPLGRENSIVTLLASWTFTLAFLGFSLTFLISDIVLLFNVFDNIFGSSILAFTSVSTSPFSQFSDISLFTKNER